MRAVLYTRVSTRAQEDGYSLEAQEKDERAYCDRQGHHIVALESDTFTGHDSLEERDGMQRAIRLIRGGQADVLVIWKIDRAGRFSLDNALLLRDVSEAGGYFESVSEGRIQNTEEGRLMLAVFSYAAEKEWSDIRTRTQRGLTERIGRGHILTSAVPLYGYRWDGDRKETYAVDPESGPVVQAIYDKADQGWSVRRITRWLQEQGIPTPSGLLHQRGQLPEKRKLGAEWGRRMVFDILTRESYTGKHAARKYENYRAKVRSEDGRVRTIVRKRIRPEGDEQRVALAIPALVSAEQFARVQALVKARQLDTEMTDEPLLNRGFAVCGVCGRPMIATKHPNRGYRIYMCSQRRAASVHGTDACPGNAFAVRADEVDQDTWERVKAIIRDEPRFTRLVEGKSAKLAERQAEAARRAEMEAQELADARARQATVYERMTRETDDTIYAMHRQELQRLNETVTALEKRAAEAQGNHEAAQHRVNAHAALLAKIDDIIASARRAMGLPETRLGDGTLVRFDHDGFRASAQRAQHARDMLEEVSLDSLDREARRAVMRLLGVKVPMYPKAHPFAQTHEHRWDLTFVGASGVPAYGSAPQPYTWSEWLSA